MRIESNSQLGVAPVETLGVAPVVPPSYFIYMV